MLTSFETNIFRRNLLQNHQSFGTLGSNGDRRHLITFQKM